MTRQKPVNIEPDSRIAAEIENAWFEAPDDAILAAPGMRAIAEEARAVLDAAVRVARTRALLAVEPRRASRRTSPRRSVPRRTVMRELLVASPRARDIIGGKSPDAMTDLEIEAALAELAAMGILPGKDG